MREHRQQDKPAVPAAPSLPRDDRVCRHGYLREAFGWSVQDTHDFYDVLLQRVTVDYFVMSHTKVFLAQYERHLCSLLGGVHRPLKRLFNRKRFPSIFDQSLLKSKPWLAHLRLLGIFFPPFP